MCPPPTSFRIHGKEPFSPQLGDREEDDTALALQTVTRKRPPSNSFISAVSSSGLVPLTQDEASRTKIFCDSTSDKHPANRRPGLSSKASTTFVMMLQYLDLYWGPQHGWILTEAKPLSEYLKEGPGLCLTGKLAGWWLPMVSASTPSGKASNRASNRNPSP